MSKSKINVVNPDSIINKYGADTLRMYEMFLGPIEQSKPWNTNGIEGVFKFLNKFWSLFHNKENFYLSDDEPNKNEYKVLHSSIKKIQDDIERLSINTCISQLMITANKLSKLNWNKRKILEPLVIITSPFAPHICEELWNKLGNTNSISEAIYPNFNDEYLIEEEYEYPIMINGKLRTKQKVGLNIYNSEIENLIKYLEKLNNFVFVDYDFALNSILDVCDILISDYSGVIFDYLYLDRPIITYTPDYNEFEKNVGFMFDPVKNNFTYNAVNINELNELILKYSENKIEFIKKHKDRRNIVKSAIFSESSEMDQIINLIDLK